MRVSVIGTCTEVCKWYPCFRGFYLFSSWHMLGEFDFREVPFADGLDETIFSDVRLIGAVSWHGRVQNVSVDVIVGALHSTLK